MARRESQGLQIALIIFVVLWLGCAISTAVFVKNYKEAVEKEKAALDQANTARIDAENARRESAEFRKILGVADAATVEVAEAQRKADHDLCGATMPEDIQDYHNMITELRKVAFDRTGEIVRIQGDLDQLRDSFQKREAIAKNQLSKAEVAQRDAEAELAKRTADMAQQIEDGKKKQGDLETQVVESQQVANKNVQAAQLKEQEAVSALANITADRDRNAKQLALERGLPSDLPDGEIKWVNQRDRIVYINVGRADHLPPQITFSVFPSNTADLTNKKTQKGSIQVTRIIGEHLAEARVLDYSLSDPLLPGDRIYTPSWNIGRVERFALGGLLDIDGDGRADNALVRSMIGQVGAIIDAEVTQEGKLIGAVTTETRFMVEGKRLSDKAVSSSENMTAIAEATQKLRTEAINKGARVISLDEFLDLVGYTRPGGRFRPGIDEYNLREGQPDSFRSRRPPGASGAAPAATGTTKSAY